MSLIMLREVGVATPEPLFQKVSFNLRAGQRLGVVAANGGGKTTLLRCVAGLVEPSSGEIICARGLRLGYVEQEVPANLLPLTVFECLRAALPTDQQHDEWRIEMLLAALEFPAVLQQREVRALSGGWQKMLLIARALMADPGALLLDEPTNHLDVAKIEQLERWLTTQAAELPMLIVSHDRHFLDACTTHTLFLRPEQSKLYAHPYGQARQLLAEDDTATKTKQEREQKEVERLRRSARELKNIGINSASDSAQKKAKQIAARAAQLEGTIVVSHQERSRQLKLSSRESYARVLLALDEVVVRAPDGKALFKSDKLRIMPGDRVVVLGANGAGKSQLIKLIHRAWCLGQPAAGVQCHTATVVGYADQQMSQLPNDDTPFALIAKRFALGDQATRTLLAGAGFAVERQQAPIGQFSLGQKARLGMLVLRLAKPSFYLLDEPTNHVDIEGQEKLEAEILAQNATCLLVSHDRSLVSAIATRIWEISQGKLVEREE